MFEQFTEGARQVVVLSQDEARALRHQYIGTEHILLGLLRDEEGLAARALQSLEITIERVRPAVVRIVGLGAGVTAGQFPFTPRAKKVLELALREALSLRHQFIGSEHILLGLIRENEGVATRILLDFGADAEKIRNEVICMLAGPKAHAESPGASGPPDPARPAVPEASAAQAPGAVPEASPAQAFPDMASMSRDELDHAIDRVVDQLFRHELENASRRRVLRQQIEALRAERNRRGRNDDDDAAPQGRVAPPPPP